MKKFAFALLLLAAAPALAALSVGATTANFTTDAVLGGKKFIFSLAKARAKGPVVLYFYPKAFTSGCTVEAHEFAEKTADFKKQGATVIGLSADDIATLGKFSIEECRNKFAVGVASDKTIKAFDVAIANSKMSNRTTYVIAPDGKIIFVYSNGSPAGHVNGAYQAVLDWSKANPKKR